VFLDPDYPSVKPYKEKFFCKKSDPLCKKIDPKIFQKTDSRFEFLDLNYPSVNPYKKFFFPFCNERSYTLTNEQTLLAQRNDPPYSRGNDNISIKEADYNKIWPWKIYNMILIEQEVIELQLWMNHIYTGKYMYKISARFF
jgi:hypothetical protein